MGTLFKIKQKKNIWPQTFIPPWISKEVTSRYNFNNNNNNKCILRANWNCLLFFLTREKLLIRERSEPVAIAHVELALEFDPININNIQQKSLLTFQPMLNVKSCFNIYNAIYINIFKRERLPVETKGVQEGGKGLHDKQHTKGHACPDGKANEDEGSIALLQTQHHHSFLCCYKIVLNAHALTFLYIYIGGYIPRRQWRAQSGRGRGPTGAGMRRCWRWRPERTRWCG